MPPDLSNSSRSLVIVPPPPPPPSQINLTSLSFVFPEIARPFPNYQSSLHVPDQPGIYCILPR